MTELMSRFRQVVESRRSVRVFTQEQIPDAVVEECLDLALLAPTSSNLQCWEFYWVKSEAQKSEMVKACLSQPAAATAQTLIVCVARTNTWKKHAKQMLEFLEKHPESPKAVKLYYSKLVPFVYGQGFLGVWGVLKKYLVLPVVGLFRPVPRGPVGSAGMREWAHKTTALACENLMLGLSAAGFDSCPMEGFDERRVKKILGLGCGSYVTMVVGAGRRAEKGIYGPRIRFPKEQFIFRV